MPATSTAVNACGVRILIDDEHGQLANVSGSANKATLKFTRELGEFKVFSETFYQRLECGEDADLSLEIIFTSATRESMDILKRWWDTKGARTINIEVPKSTDGWGGEYLMTDLEIPLDAADAKPIMVKVNLKPNGRVGRYMLVA
jgi:hypothetical protein